MESVLKMRVVSEDERPVFNNDKVDAGDIGAGHQVTAFYEVVPTEVGRTVRPEVDALKYQNDSPEWMTVKLRYKAPGAEISELESVVFEGEVKPWREQDADFRFASGVALWGKTEGSEEGIPLVEKLLEGTLKGDEKREEFEELLKLNPKQR